MPQLTASSVFALSILNRSSNGPTRNRPASMTAETIPFDAFAPRTNSRIPATMTRRDQHGDGAD